MKHAFPPLACLSFLVALAQPAAAFDVRDVVQARLLPGWKTDHGTQITALHLQLAPGWHTYWRAPGEAGIAPQFDLTGSANVGGMVVHWPRPEVFVLSDMRTIGYTGDVVLPLEFTPHATGDMQVRTQVTLGVCRDICVPVSFQLDSLLKGDGLLDPVILSALDRQPEPLGQTAAALCSLTPIADGMRMTAQLSVPDLGGGDVGVIEVDDPTIWVSNGQTSRQGDVVRITADLVPPAGAPFGLDRSLVRMTVLGKAGAVEVMGCSAG